jgi:hypothetical protein
MEPVSARVDYTPEELLSEPEVSAPLIANGVLCHGGFDQSGAYLSPRTPQRWPAIQAWQQQLRQAGVPLIAIDEGLLPPQYPSVAQAKLLVTHGYPEPVVRALTVISIVEGFGAIIRDVTVPPLAQLFVEPIAGTALAHLDRGLFEAHARDEAGYRDRGGHKQMWEAARDLALENPKIPSDVFLRLMGERGQARAADPLFPQLDKRLYRMLSMLVQVFVVEVFARRTFAWASELLGDPHVSAAPLEAAAMIGYISADEAPHVEYLRATLTETRSRTLRTVDGATLPGRTVVDALLHRMLSQAITTRPREQRDHTRSVLARAAEASQVPAALLEEFDTLTPQFVPPERTGFEALGLAS